MPDRIRALLAGNGSAPASLDDRLVDLIVATVLRVRTLSARMNVLMPKLLAAMALPLSVIRMYARTRCNYLAAAIAFQVTLCLIPYLLLAASIMGYLATDIAVSDNLTNYIHLNFPTLKDSLASVIQGVTHMKEELGVIGLLGLFWTSRGLVFSIAFALDTIHGSPGEKALWRRLVDTMLVLLLATLLITASFVFSAALTWISKASGIALTEGYSLNAISFPFSVAVSTIIFMAFYQVLPQQRPSWWHAAIGGLTGAAFWELSKYGLIVYFALEATKYKEIYGTLAVMVYVILWGYLFATGVLIGACTAQRLDQDRRRKVYVAE